MAYATLDFSKKAKVGDDLGVFDAIATGVNMLGEELKATTISLNEKVTLLKEIHHRVKNNLQIVSSILSIQSQFIDDPIALEKFNDCRLRIKSIALVHEKVYESSHLNEINFKDYVDAVLASYRDFFKSEGNDAVLHYESDDSEKTISIDLAMPLSLIVNELLANSFKYAFKNRVNNKIIISFKGDGSDESPFILKVNDNGIGAQGKFDPKNALTLGAVLIKALIDQLSAEYEISDQNGTSVEVIFKSPA
jgi:two-component sensor histidine kinase